MTYIEYCQLLADKRLGKLEQYEDTDAVYAEDLIGVTKERHEKE